jgi:RND family efflux transporter MFP subunit
VRISLADDEEFSLTGTLVFSDNQIDSGTGTLRVRALITNPKIDRPPYYMLSPGQFVRIRMPVGPPRDAILVSEKAIGSDQGQRYVFVVNDQNVVERRNVRVGQQYGTLRVIEDGVVTPSDRVIVEGLLRVRPGAEVNPKPAPQQPKSPAAAPAKVVVQAPAPHPKT